MLPYPLPASPWPLILLLALLLLLAAIRFSWKGIKCQRSTVLAVLGTIIAFSALPLSQIFLKVMDADFSKETVESWLFSFRLLGVALFVWGAVERFSIALEARAERNTESPVSEKPAILDRRI